MGFFNDLKKVFDFSKKSDDAVPMEEPQVDGPPEAAEGESMESEGELEDEDDAKVKARLEGLGYL